MRIGQISTLASPVRQRTFGSVESLVWLLSRELTRLGHQVTIFGAGGSEADAEIIVTQPGPYGENGALDDWHLCEWVNLCRAIRESSRFDVLHSHAYLWGIPLEPLSRSPMLHTMHIVPDENAAHLWSNAPGSCVTAISEYQWSAYPQLRPAAVIPHGVDVSQFTFRADPDDYVCYLGRFEPGKGPRQAIVAARQAGVRLLMAGPSNPYFRENVQPLIDGSSVEYVGFVSGKERDKLLGGAKALLYPIQYAESFGLVLVEAMLCGTPIVAMNVGAVPAIVEHSVSGYCATTKEEFCEAIPKAMQLDRARVREKALQRFSVEKMTEGYLAVYERLAAKK